MPEAGFFVCQQRFPENFWSPAAQVHPNGALGIVGLTVVCDRPAEATAFLAAFLDAPGRPIGGGAAFALEGARLECLTPATYAAQFGAPPAGPGLAAMRIAVADLGASERLLRANRIDPRGHAGMAIVDASAAMGALIAFVAPA